MSVHTMEPLLPFGGQLDDSLHLSALELRESAAALVAPLPAPLRLSIAQRVRSMNSYYSNLIEGHITHPLDIDRALRNDYSSEGARADLQYEACAHIEVQLQVEARLRDEPALSPASVGFLRWVHELFYAQMPERLRFARERSGRPVRDSSGAPIPVQGGAFRTHAVEVGAHVPPDPAEVPALMARFEERFDSATLPAHQQLPAAFAAHHRLAWIHPFIDGNGRVTRLFTDAFMLRLGVGGVPLWTMSRGLARRRDDYMSALTWADQRRRNDLDGRGPLSLEGLQRFTHFMFDVARDQVSFMARLLELDALERRIASYVQRRAAEGGLRAEARYVLCEVVRRGELSRGDAARVSGLGERVARSLLSTLLKEGLLESDGHRSPLRLGLPARVLPAYLPGLYPRAIEEDFERLPSPT